MVIKQPSNWHAKQIILDYNSDYFEYIKSYTTHELQYNIKILLNFDELSVTKIVHIIEPIKNPIILSRYKITEKLIYITYHYCLFAEFKR